MFSRTCFCGIRGDTTKWFRVWLTSYCALVFLFAWWPWNILRSCRTWSTEADLAIEKD